jgi:hypothetical protein
MVRPRIVTLSSDTDLCEEYLKRIKKIKINMWIWAFSWLNGLLLAAYSLFS